ncbi:MAG: ATP-binding protein [Myxococcota bacterium]
MTPTDPPRVSTLFRTLYAKLALVLIALLTAVGAVYLGVVLYSTRVYQQEMIQRLHESLAQNLATEPLPVEVDQVDPSTIGAWFRVFTTANPSIELYLLDLEGRIIAQSADPSRLQLPRISLEPIRTFLEGSQPLPILGDDPLRPERREAFSAAPILVDGKRRGYLYAVLGSERYLTVTQLLQRSQALRLAVTVVVICSVLGLIAGVFTFRLLTSRLQRLSHVIAEFQETGHAPRLGRRLDGSRFAGDEVDRIEAAFDGMVERITEQVAMLEKADEVRRELIAGVSHDLRTPLTTLRGYLETLLFAQRPLSEDERRAYLESAIEHGKRLARLIGSLSELARLDAPEMRARLESFPLAELVQDVVQKLALAAAEQGIDLRADLRPDLPPVWVDLELIERVFENLLQNALRYTPPGGQVTVALEPCPGGVAVSVSDTGPGIDPGFLPHVFDRFSRQRKGAGGKSDGMGLGLAITRRILELHGSQIAVESRPGQGTRFSFRLSTQPPDRDEDFQPG